jgi:hypothetical protein
MNFKDLQGQLARWLEVLSQYIMQIQHCSGNKHVNADILLPELVSFAMQISIVQKQSAVLLPISMASFWSTLSMEPQFWISP